MRVKWMLPALLILLLSGCANQPTERSGQVIDRLPATNIPATPGQLGFDEMVRLAAEGLSAPGIIDRLRASGTRYRLSAAEVLELSRRGVPLPVIDHLLVADRQALLDDCSAQVVRREAEARDERQQAELLCQQRCSLACPASGGWPYYGSPYWRRWP